MRGRVTFLPAAPEPGDMGAVSEGLVVALGSGGALSVLFGSLAVWLGRVKTATVVEIIDGHGRVIKVSSGDPERVGVLLDQARDQLERFPIAGPG